MTLSVKWFQDVSPDKKQDREETVRNGHTVLGYLVNILDKEISALEKTPSDQYDKPNWPLWQADRTGQIRALKQIRDLCKLDPKE